MHTSFVNDTLDFLYKGGRCIATELVIGSLLKIRPIIEVKADGILGIQKKVDGSRKKALDSLAPNFKHKLIQIDTRRVFIKHMLCQDDAMYLKERLLNLTRINELLITLAGSTIASHCRPNTIGILHMEKTRVEFTFLCSDKSHRFANF